MNTLLALSLGTSIWGFALQMPLATPDLLPERVAEIEAARWTSRPTHLGWEQSHNAAMINWTRALQVSATVTMAVTGAIGFFQFHDEYGLNGSYSQTPCGTGSATLGYCGDEMPWPHLIAAGSSISLLVSAIGVSTEVDFDLAAQRDPDWRTYETMRWVALGLGVVQGLAGAFLANSIRMGILSPQGDFDTMQALAITHLALGGANVALNTYNSILLF